MPPITLCQVVAGPNFLDSKTEFSKKYDMKPPHSIFFGAAPLPALALVFSALLLFTWPIPGTIALRHFLLFSSLAFALAVTVKNPGVNWRAILYSYRKPLFPLLAFLAWIILGASLWSPERSWAIQEIVGQWPRPLAALLLGIMIAITLSGLPAYRANHNYRTVIFLCAVIACQLIAHWIDVIYGLLVLDLPQFKASRFFGTRLNVSYLTNTLAALTISASVSNILSESKISRNSFLAMAAMAIIVIATTIVLDTRNGYLGLAALIITAGTFALFARGAKMLKYIPFALLFASLLLFSTIKLDSRWETFNETAHAALDIEKNTHWRHYNITGELPLLASGQPADESAYIRIASLRASASLAADYPFGYGFGRNAFGHAAKTLHGEGVGNSHSGLCDILVGTGFIGIGLWLMFLGGFLWLAIRRLKTRITPETIALFFLVSGYIGRSLVDSNIRDFPLEMFMFMLGLLSFQTVREQFPHASDLPASKACPRKI